MLKKILCILIILIIIPSLIGNTQNNLYINLNAATINQVNAGVLVSNINDPYLNLIKQGLENIQRNNENKVKFTFYY